MLSEVKKLITEHNYIVLKNGIISEKNFDFNNFIIEKDTEFVLFNYVNENVDFNLEVKNNANVRIVEICYLENSAVLNKNIVCSENSHLELVTFETGKENGWVNVKTVLDEGSYINNKKICLFDSEINENEKVYLKGVNGNYYTLNVYVNSSNKKQNIDTTIYHQCNDTVSQLYNYGICKGTSVLNINTNGVVEKGAVRSDLKQKSKGVLLDLESSISANPLLQIDEYDCLASHGAGIGAIDEEDLYYLMSRGLTRSDSGKLIIAGFIDPVIEGFPEGEFRNYILEFVNKYL